MPIRNAKDTKVYDYVEPFLPVILHDVRQTAIRHASSGHPDFQRAADAQGTVALCVVTDGSLIAELRHGIADFLVLRDANNATPTNHRGARPAQRLKVKHLGGRSPFHVEDAAR